MTVHLTDDPANDTQDDWYEKAIPIFYPHELLSYIFDEVQLRVPEQALRTYWSKARLHGVPWATATDPNGPLRIPLKFFADDAAVNDQGDKVFAFVISSPLFRPNSARTGKWPVAVINLRKSVGWATIRPILYQLVLSLNEAYDNPTRSGFRFQVTEIGMDWKALRECFQLRSHWNRKLNMCHHCRVTADTYCNLEEPTWHTTNSFIAEVLQPNNVTPLILLRGFDLSVVSWCSLHNLNLGLLWTVNGGALAYLLECGTYGDPQAEGLQECLRKAYADFKSWQASCKIFCSQRPFTVKMLFKAAHGAYLNTKGFNGRCLTAYLADKSQAVLNAAPHPSDELVLQTHALLHSFSSFTCSERFLSSCAGVLHYNWCCAISGFRLIGISASVRPRPGSCALHLTFIQNLDTCSCACL